MTALVLMLVTSVVPAGSVEAQAPPGRPSSVSVERADGTVTASWPAVAWATGYHITYTTDGGSTWSLAAFNHPSVSITISGTDNEATYMVGVRAGNSAGWGPWRNSPTASPYTSPVSPPGRPSSVSVERADGTVTASWPAVAWATGYHITYTTDGGSTWSLAAFNHPSVSITISGTDNEATYMVGVRAGNSAGWGPWRNSPTASPYMPPAALTGLVATAGDGSLTLVWDDPSNPSITSYNGRYRPTGGTWTTHSHTGSTTSTTITGLTNDIQYEVQIRATNAIGTSEWSPIAKATPRTAVPDCAPGTLSAPTIRPAGLHWTVTFESPPLGCATSHDSIDLRYKAADVSTWTTKSLAADAVETTITSGLSMGVYYEVQISAANQAGRGPWSPIATATATAYSLAETGVQNYSQIWTVYLCGGGDWVRGGDYDTAQDYADLLNNWLTPRLSEITAGEYEPTFIAATGDMPTGTHTGGYSLYYDCKAEEGQHIVFGHHSGTGYGGLATLCAPEGWHYAFVNVPTHFPQYSPGTVRWGTLKPAGHEIGHILGWSHYRNSADPYEFMNTKYNAPYDQGNRYTWCGNPTPSRPLSVSVERGDGVLTVSWPPVNGATGYHITYSSDGENSWSLAAGNHPSTSITIDGADNSKTYVAGVRAGNAHGWGSWRNSPAAGPYIPPPPPAPSGLAAASGDAGMTLSWDDPSDSSITGYSVRYRPTGETWVSHPLSGLATSTAISGLTNDIQYEAQVSAANAGGSSEWSPSAKATPQIPTPPCPPATPSAPTIRPAGLHWTVMFDSPPLLCGISHDSIHLRYKAADVSTWTMMSLPSDAVQATINSGLSFGVYYEVQIRATNRVGLGPWSPIATATATAYSLAETGVQDRSQTWTVYLCGGGAARHEDFDTAEDYADFLNEELTPRLSEITAGEYEPTFIAATGEMPTGTHTGGYSLYYDCKAENGQHIVFGHHSGTGYGGASTVCGKPDGYRYAFVNENTVSAVYPREVIEKSIWHTAGHEIGHILGWSHYRSSADPYEFMNNIYDAPFDQGNRYTWCGS